MKEKKTKFKVNQQITYEKVEDLTIVVNTDSGEYYNLNQTGSVILELIKNGCPVDDIIAALKKRYPNAGKIEDDVNFTIEEFIKRNILICEEEG